MCGNHDVWVTGGTINQAATWKNLGVAEWFHRDLIAPHVGVTSKTLGGGLYSVANSWFTIACLTLVGFDDEAPAPEHWTGALGNRPLNCDSIHAAFRVSVFFVLVCREIYVELPVFIILWPVFYVCHLIITVVVPNYALKR